MVLFSDYHDELSKPLTVQHLMPYINDLADQVVSVSGWLGMDGELEVIKRTPGIINPEEQLQELLRKWLEDTERPTAPHTWEYFVRVIGEVRKGHVADRILEDVFTGECGVRIHTYENDMQRTTAKVGHTIKLHVH